MTDRHPHHFSAKTPPSPADRYPLRSFAVTLREVVGWPEERVTATLGPPDEKAQGEVWQASADSLAMDRAGRPVHVFGHVPSRIPTLMPYEQWSYHNVQGQTWVLYLALPLDEEHGETKPAAAHRPEVAPRSVWHRIAGLFWARPRVVVEVWCYPTGAVF